MLYKIFNIILIINQVSCKTSLRVIGGRLALKDEFPFVVQLEIALPRSEYLNDSLFIKFCTGSALTPVWTLTAGHCVESVTEFHPFKSYIRYNNYFPTDMGNVSEIVNTELHPRYKYNEFGFMRHDLGLLVTQPIRINEFAKLSAQDYKTLYGQEAVSVGYGASNTSIIPTPLQVLKGMLEKCPRSSIFTGFCLLMPCGVKVALTRGDSGGPAIHKSGIVGVNSMTNADYNERKETLKFRIIRAPSGYIAAVSADLTWIHNILKSNV